MSSTIAPDAPITFAHITEAAARISPLAHRTPVMTSRLFDDACGKQVFFKCENFQRGGSFKIRGAANLILSLNEQERKRGVVAFSSGNHAQAVAIAAESIGAPATIVMPSDAPKSKLAATRAHGARVILYNRQTEDREAIGKRVSEETGAVLVPPFDHPMIVAGQGTATLELLADVESLDALVVCVGGGGLISGALLAAREMHPRLKVFGVEPETGNDFYLSHRAGERIEVPPPDTIADGLRTPKPGAVTFPIVHKLVEDILLVSDDEIREVMRFLLTRMKMVAEPSGAVAPAALFHRKLPASFARTGVIISGGNIDLDLLSAICRIDACPP
jgi:threonine dehydratase